ncbi:hypothetical protein OROGR_021241 [Orobanche gracilis]
MSVLEPSALGRWYDIFNDKASLLRQYPLTDPQNSCGAASINPGILGTREPLSSNKFAIIRTPCEENHLNGGGDQINAGASEDEMRKKCSRPSTTNSFQENGWETFFDGGASYFPEFSLTDPQNFDGATASDPGTLGTEFRRPVFSNKFVVRNTRGASENLMRIETITNILI